MLEQLLFKEVAASATDGIFSTSHPQSTPGLLGSGTFGEEGLAPLLFGVVSMLFSLLLCLAHVKQWSKGDFWGACTPHSPHAVGSLCCPCASAPHPWANPTAKVIQCASALTFMGALWLFCVEHIILMGGNQINSKPHLTSASCEDSGNSVCCIPSSPIRGNLLASNACCVQWESRNQYHCILLCYFTTVWIFIEQRTQLKYCLTPHTTPAHVHIDGERTHLHLQAANCEVLQHNRDCAGI